MERSAKGMKDRDGAAKAVAEPHPLSPHRQTQDAVPAGDVLGVSASSGWIHQSPRMVAQRALVSRLFGSAISAPTGTRIAAPAVQRVIVIDKKEKALDEVIDWVAKNFGSGMANSNVAKAVKDYLTIAENSRMLQKLINDRKSIISLDKTNIFEVLLKPHFGIDSRQSFTDKTDASKEKGSKAKSKAATVKRRNHDKVPFTAPGKNNQSTAALLDQSTSPSMESFLRLDNVNQEKISHSMPSASNWETFEFPSWQEPQSRFKPITLDVLEKTFNATPETLDGRESEELVEVNSVGLALEDVDQTNEMKQEKQGLITSEKLILQVDGLMNDCNHFLRQPMVCDRVQADKFQKIAIEVLKEAKSLRSGLKMTSDSEGLRACNEIFNKLNKIMSSGVEQARKTMGPLPRCVNLLYQMGLKNEQGFEKACTNAVDLREFSAMKKVVGELLAAKIVETSFSTAQDSSVEIVRDIVALRIQPISSASSVNVSRKRNDAMASDPTMMGVLQTEFDALVCQGVKGSYQILHTLEAKGGKEDPTDQIAKKQRPFLKQIAENPNEYCFAISVPDTSVTSTIGESESEGEGAQEKEIIEIDTYTKKTKEKYKSKAKKKIGGKAEASKEEQKPEIKKVWKNLNSDFKLSDLFIGQHTTITAGPASHFSIDFTQQLGISDEQFNTLLDFIARDNLKK